MGDNEPAPNNDVTKDTSGDSITLKFPDATLTSCPEFKLIFLSAAKPIASDALTLTSPDAMSIVELELILKANILLSPGWLVYLNAIDEGE